MSRIDHIFGNFAWFDTFSDCIASFLPEGLSDHAAILVNTSVLSSNRKAPFKIFNHLLEHPYFMDILSSSWDIP